MPQALTSATSLGCWFLYLHVTAMTRLLSTGAAVRVHLHMLCLTDLPVSGRNGVVSPAELTPERPRACTIGRDEPPAPASHDTYGAELDILRA